MEAPPDGRDAADVSVSHRGHGDHEEVDALPVAQLLAVVKVGRVAGVLQLESEPKARARVWATTTTGRTNKAYCSLALAETTAAAEKDYSPQIGQ